MLSKLHIKNFIIVEEAEIYFSNGFTVFSGETGAGKSILIDALSLVLGHRINKNTLININSNIEIIATFENNKVACNWLHENHFDIKSEIILKRIIDKNFRSKTFINDTPCTITTLKKLGSMLIKIYGQHTYQDLLNTESQRNLLDNYGELNKLLQETKNYWQEWQLIKKELTRTIELSQTLQEELNILENQAKEIQAINFSLDEWNKIQHEHTKLSNIEFIVNTCNVILNHLDGEKISIYKLLNNLTQHTKNIIEKDPYLNNIHNELNSAQIIIKESIYELNNYLSKIEIDSQNINLIESRLKEILNLSKKLKISPCELNEIYNSILNRISTIKKSTNLKEIEQKEQEIREKYLQTICQLSIARKQKAYILGTEVTKIMKNLSMENTRFNIEITDSNNTSHGKDHIEFLISHQGSPSKGIAKIASGGELSRIYLAISVVTNHNSNIPTLIFDEVDNGVSGAAAETIGKLLQQLGNNNQVLCITHLPQVAIYGNSHFLVSKYQNNLLTLSKIEFLSHSLRVKEIARMLGGIKITTTTLNHAKEMLHNAKL
ncbi:DNA repair protein RecN [Candidatus Kinetoplastibacterium desouzaii TCC079E]|uniref:DNA repair protein RecN n=1 Tax=Candidatus Kinetoplastidibacterium desouzai TCC079E TaxID=1208919 RepID=M1L2U7_9PROT|nr:DNA repair protein RecN [Candidatus Kinetoplastibacterium desouzaii]AGF47078.1 DNA repair protein RecN [Candidatus Kinetoplastibacterium desouzaii TCC079E]